MKSIYKKAPSRSQQGVSMLEVLVALLITTIGLLGFGALQSRALTATEDTYVRMQATTIAREVIERMRMNGVTGEKQSSAVSADDDADLQAYVSSASWTSAIPAQNCFGTEKTCSVEDMARFDIAQIRQMVETNGSLPNGSVFVSVCSSDGGADDRICAFVAWGRTTAAECADAMDVGISECVMVQGT